MAKKTKNQTKLVTKIAETSDAALAASMNNLMGSSVEKAYNMAVEGGASIANPTSVATKIGNVDSLPRIELWGQSSTVPTEVYRTYRSKPKYLKARIVTVPEVIETKMGTLHGKPGDYRVIDEKGNPSFMPAKELLNQYDLLG